MKNKKKAKNAIIIAGGELKGYEKMKKLLQPHYRDNTIIISADGGLYNTIKMGFRPHTVIGDMDSIDADIKKKYMDRLSGVEFISFPRDKDESDTRLALEHALALDVKDITLAGVSGGRLDHTFANIMMLASPGLAGIDIRILDGDMEAFPMHGSGTVKGAPGKIISLFSLTPRTTFISTRGLKYQLKDETLDLSPVRGLSNIFTRKEAFLDFKDGKLLVIKEI